MADREKTPFEQAIERSVGMPIEEIQSTPISTFFDRAEKRTGKSMRGLHVSKYETYLTKDELDKELDKALKPDGCLPKIFTIFRFRK